MKTKIKAMPAEALARIIATDGDPAESIETCRYSIATSSGTIAANLYCRWDACTEGAVWDLEIEGSCHESEYTAGERDILVHAMEITAAREWKAAPYMTASKRSSAYMLIP